jgi:phage tail-like protein
VHDSSKVLANSIQRIRGESERFPGNSKSFRRDLLIVVYNRGGTPTKGWLLYNCWPSSYKPGDDLSGQAEEKLIEELTVTYESFEEISKDTLISGAFSAAVDLIDG